MKTNSYKLKTSTAIKLFLIWLVVYNLFLFPLYYFCDFSSTILMATTPFGVLIFIFMHRFYIRRAKKKGCDMTKPI